MKTKIYGAMVAICAMFSLIVCIGGVIRAEVDGNADLLFIGVGIMLIALVFDKLREASTWTRRGRR